MRLLVNSMAAETLDSRAGDDWELLRAGAREWPGPLNRSMAPPLNLWKQMLVSLAAESPRRTLVRGELTILLFLLPTLLPPLSPLHLMFNDARFC